MFFFEAFFFSLKFFFGSRLFAEFSSTFAFEFFLERFGFMVADCKL